MKKIAILGGGITGLTAAFHLEKARRAGANLEYTLFERTNRLGGALLTEHVEGCLVEGGADSFLTEKAWAIELCRQLGIDDQLVGSNDAGRQTFILHRKKLVPLPAGMVFFVPTDLAAIKKSALFSAAAKRRISQVAASSAVKPAVKDVSVAAFVERHFGLEMVERVADPLLAGIYGGDARSLSMRAVLPRFLDLEQRFGSLTQALKAEGATQIAKKPLFTTLKNGMQQLADALVAQLDPKSIRRNTEISGLSFSGDRWRLISKKGGEDFDALVIASPAYAAAALLKAHSPLLARMLRKIPYSSSAAVTLAYSTTEIGAKKLRQLPGFGFLVPQREGRRALACTFVHNKFPGRVPADRVLLRLFFGGTRDEKVLDFDDHALVSLARRELKAILGLQLNPSFSRVYRWPKAMPQYNLGHPELVQGIEAEVRCHPGLVLAGSAYHGVGVPDCVREGTSAASQALSKVPSTRAT